MLLRFQVIVTFIENNLSFGFWYQQTLFSPFPLPGCFIGFGMKRRVELLPLVGGPPENLPNRMTSTSVFYPLQKQVICFHTQASHVLLVKALHRFHKVCSKMWNTVYQHFSNIIPPVESAFDIQ